MSWSRLGPDMSGRGLNDENLKRTPTVAVTFALVSSS